MRNETAVNLTVSPASTVYKVAAVLALAVGAPVSVVSPGRPTTRTASLASPVQTEV